MKQSFNLHTNLKIFVIIIILFASCKKSSDTTPPPSPALPVINSFSPATGTAGTTVTISGKNFSPTVANDIVSFNGASAIVTSATSAQIIVSVPNGATTGKITVKVSSNTAASADNFTVTLNQLSEARGGVVAASAGNKILFAGGSNIHGFSKTVDIYDVTTNVWTTAQLSQARFELTAASAGNKILFAGGYLDDYSSVSTVDIYDVSTNTWTTAHLSEARSHLSAASAGTKIFFAGGSPSDYIYSKTVDIYDVATDTWTSAQLSKARFGLSAASAGNKIIFAGGIDDSAVTGKTVDIYNVATNTWTTSQLSEERFYGSNSGAAAGSKVVFAGGIGGASAINAYSKVVDIYDVNTNSWTKSQLSDPKSYLAAVGTANTIVFAGGVRVDTNGQQIFYKSVDVYDANTNTWTSANLSEARDFVAGAAAGNKIVIAGGFNGTDAVKTVDIYDVQTGVWTH